MASLSFRPDSDLLAQCFTLVRWLHENGISWCGTPSELVNQLARYDSTLQFSSADELVVFLETNADKLRELGLDASVRKQPGRPRFIEVQTCREQAASEVVGPVEVATASAEPKRGQAAIPVEAEPAPPVADNKLDVSTSEVVDDYVPHFANKADSPHVNRLYSLLGLPAEEYTRGDFVAESNESFLDSSKDGEIRGRLLPLIFAPVVLVLAVLAFGFASHRSRVPEANQPAASENAPAAPIDPVEAKKTQALLQKASTSRASATQYDLAMRYQRGLGVERDNAAAYAWLTLAGANGSTRATEAIREFGPMSPADMQKAGILVGKAFASGVNVRRSYVIAYNWFSIADLAGSSEAGALRKELKAKMTPEQIDRASTQAASR
jgi:hypothetical protein